MIPTVPPSRPKIFFGLIIAYVIFLVAVGLWMPERLQTLSAVIGFVVVFISEFVVEAIAQAKDAKTAELQHPDPQSR